MNTQILEMAAATISATLIIVLCYLVAKITLLLLTRKIREEREMLYDLLDQRDEELERYHSMFGPLKDWEDSNWVEKAEKVRNGSMGPDEDEELPF